VPDSRTAIVRLTYGRRGKARGSTAADGPNQIQETNRRRMACAAAWARVLTFNLIRIACV